MTNLKAKAPAAIVASKAKVLIYGPPGAGKSWVALEFPSPFYADTEGGVTQKEYTEKLVASNGAYFGPDEGSQDFKTVMEQVRELSKGGHPFKTFVLDSGSKLFNDTIAREADRIEEAGQKDEFGSSKRPAVAFMRKLTAWLQRMDMNTIIVAHEKPEWGIDPKTGQRTEVGKTADIWDRLSYELDLTLQVFRQGNSRKARVIKTRLPGFPDGAVFDWSYAELCKRFGEDAINREMKAIELPSEEQLTQLAGLIARNKVPQETQEKWMKAAKVSSYEDMEAKQVQGIIDHLSKAE
jgi:RecA/RadA recombinase